MIIYNKDNLNQIVENPDLAKGYLCEVEVVKGHKEQLTETKESGGEMVTTTYPACDIVEKVIVYASYTPSELKSAQISELQRQLCETDYKAIKYAEGEITAAEYASTKELRQRFRQKINELEASL